MVGDEEVHDTNLRFGSDRLLKDLVEYIFWAHPDSRRKLVLIGDHRQLPLVHAATSPAPIQSICETHTVWLSRIHAERLSAKTPVLHSLPRPPTA